MIKQRLIVYKDGNGDSWYKCQYKWWKFWFYYNDTFLGLGIRCAFKDRKKAMQYLKDQKAGERKFHSYIYVYGISEDNDVVYTRTISD